MITAEIFWNQVEIYNVTIFPMQVIIMVVGILLTYLLFAKPNTKTNNLMKAYLSFIFAWNGIVFFLIFGRDLVPTIYFGAPLCLLAAILFARDIFANKIQFRLPEKKWQKYLTAFFILYAFLYPLIGCVFGHCYPKTAIFGVVPCPTIVFALALLATAVPRVDKKVYILLLLWAIPAIPACFGLFGLYEDCILFWVGIYALFMLIKNWKVIGRQ